MRARVEPLALVAFALIGACAAPAPQRSPPALARVVVSFSATLAVEGSRSAMPPNAPEKLALVPTVAEVETELRSAALRESVFTEIGDAAHAVDVDLDEQGGAVRFLIRAPEPWIADVGCRAVARLAVARIEAKAGGGVEAWLDGETSRLEGEIATLDRELALTSQGTGEMLTLPPMPASRDAVLGAVRVLWQVSSTEGDRTYSPLVRAIGGLLNEARRDREVRIAEGLGLRHPEVKALDARASWLTARLDAQRALDVRGAIEVDEAMRALPSKADAQAVAQALARRLRRVDLAHVSAVDPLPLQDLAVSAMLLSVDDAWGAAGRGPAHPSRIALRRRLAVIEESFSREVRDHADVMAAVVPGLERSLRADRLRDQAVRLTATLARLKAWRETARIARWRVWVPCARVYGS